MFEPPVRVTDPASRTRIALIVAIILLLSAGVRMYQLATPRAYMFDEVYYAKDAKAIVDGRVGPKQPLRWAAGDEVSWPHPEMGKFAIAAGILLFGDRSFGWRAPCVVAGMVLLACVYPLARRLGLSPSWSLVALGLAAADTLNIAQSRIATLDVFLAMWTVLCILCALKYVQDGRRILWLLMCGACGGLALSTKWSGVLTLVAAAVIIGIARWQSRPRRAKDGDAVGGAARRPSRARRIKSAVLAALPVAAALAVLPAVIYLASYVQYFARGHTLPDFRELHSQMVYFNTHLKATHSYASASYTWIVNYRPVWYYFEGVRGHYRGVDGIGNPFLWWFATLALLSVPVLAVLKRTRLLAAPALFIALLYFPWFAVSRTSFLYYMAPVAPFMAIIVAAALCAFAGTRRLPRHGVPVLAGFALATALLWEPIGRLCSWVFWGLPRSVSPAFGWVGLGVGLALVAAVVVVIVLPGQRRYRPLVAMALAGTIIGISVAFMPIVLNIPISPSHFDHITWFPSWV